MMSEMRGRIGWLLVESHAAPTAWWGQRSVSKVRQSSFMPYPVAHPGILGSACVISVCGLELHESMVAFLWKYK